MHRSHLNQIPCPVSASVQAWVVHGDFHYDNILWDDCTHRLRIIDFDRFYRAVPS
ncbi:phosphotransferase [Paenibacillus sp. 79R4]|uniref:phosphotransferase n=1 Tax=unclassified Paenibacillus TaxID=185978 RepID=UPI0015BF97D4|nr:hypothetical protein [Paenibacillus sp. 79R4]